MAGWITGIAVGALVVVMYRRGFSSGRASAQKDSVRSAVRGGADAVKSFFRQEH